MGLLLQRWPLPEPRPSVEVVMGLALRDSKRGLTNEAEDEISDVLLRKMGDVVPTATNNLSKFPCALVEEWLQTMGFPSEKKEMGFPSEKKEVANSVATAIQNASVNIPRVF